MTHNKKIGKCGEQMAEKFLTQKGYVIREKNYRYKRVEIDIIASDGPTLVFVEVKTRSNHHYGYPESAVGVNKIAAIYKGAGHYIYEHNWRGAIRFDIIAILICQPTEIKHFRDAF